MCSSQQPQQQQPTNTSQTTSNIPDWAIPSATKNLGRAEALTDINQNPYQTYQGNRVADFNPLQNQAFTNVAGMTTNTGTGNAMNQTQDTYNRSANAAPYNAQNFGNQYGSGPQFQNMGLGYLSANAPELNQYQMGPAERVRSQNFGQQSAQDYMSPYQQFVTDFQKEEAVRDYNRGAPAAGAGASRAGAFGGSRQAIVASEANRNLQNQLGGIQAAGSQNAYQNAQQQFNADQARRMQSQMANQQAGLTVGQQNLQSQLQTQALGSGQSMQAQLANQGAYGQMQGLGMQQNLSANQQAMQNAAQRAQYGLSGQQAGEQSRQFGANYGLQNRQQALAAAGQLGTLGQQQYAQQMGINAAQQQAGAQMQAQEQQGLSNKYQDFLNQQNYPYKQIGFMSDIIRGTPTSGGAQSMYQAPPSGISQFAGLAGGLGSLYGAYNQANRVATGGEIKGFKEGGSVSHFDEGGLASLPNAAEMLAAKDINSGKAKLPDKVALGGGIGELLMASMQLKKATAELEALKLASGANPQTTVAQDISSQQQQVAQGQLPQQPQQQQQQPQQPQQPQPPQGMPPQGMPPEQPQGPTMMAAEGGLTSLPVDNFNPENYAGGGIIAFAAGDRVKGADDEMFKRLIQQESGNRQFDQFGNLLTSSAGAEGITQAMPKTQASPGFGVPPMKDKSETEFLRFGRDYLNAMVNRYGDAAKGAAAYNYGPGNLDKVLKKHSDDWIKFVPKETQKYVANVAAPTNAASPRVDFVAKPEGMASRALSFLTGSNPAYGADSVKPVTTPQAPVAAGDMDSLGEQYDVIKGQISAVEKARKEGLGAIARARDPEKFQKQQKSFKDTLDALGKKRDDIKKGYEASFGANAYTGTPEQRIALEQARPPTVATPAIDAASRVSGFDVPSQDITTKSPAAPVDSAKPVATPAKPSLLDSTTDALAALVSGMKPVQTKADFDKNHADIAEKYGTDTKSTKKFFDDQAANLTAQVAQAKNDRNVNLWMSAAQGFFAMAGGMSPYAMKNFADGAGIGTKQATAAFQEYQKDQSEINKAKRELGKLEFTNKNISAKEEEDRGLKYQSIVDKHEENQFRNLSTLANHLNLQADLKVRNETNTLERTRQFNEKMQLARQAAERKVQEDMIKWENNNPEILTAPGSPERKKRDADKVEKEIKLRGEHSVLNQNTATPPSGFNVDR